MQGWLLAENVPPVLEGIGWGGIPGSHQGGVSRAYQAISDSDLAVWGRAQQRKDGTRLPATQEDDSTQGKWELSLQSLLGSHTTQSLPLRF